MLATPAAAATTPTWSPCSLPVISTLCGVPGDVAGSAFDAIATEFGKAAAALLDALLGVISATTSVRVTADWFEANYRTIAKVGLSALLVLLFVQLISTAIQRRPGGITRAAVGTVTALLGTAALLAVTQIALQITDNICGWIAGTGTDPIRALVSRLLPLAALPQASGALLLVGSLLVIVGGFVLWAVLLFRKIAIYLVLVFAPVALAGQAWEGSRSWTRRALHALAALIFCKIAIVTVFVLGAAAAGQGSGLTTFLTGVILLGVACLAPWLTFRFFHFVDLAIAHEHYRMLRETPAGAPVRTASSAVARAQRLAGWVGAGAGAGLSRAGSAGTAGMPGREPPGQGGPSTGAGSGSADRARSPASSVGNQVERGAGGGAAPTRADSLGHGTERGPSSAASACPPPVPPPSAQPPPSSGPPLSGGEAREGGPA